jgi:hypothetical protein
MPKRDLLFKDLEGEHDFGVLLLAQMGGVPNELQLIIETTEYDEAVQGFRPRRSYVVRALGVREHRLSLGLFGRIALLDDHPVLYHHNTPRVAVHFDGKPANINEMIIDLSQTYVSTFGRWRSVAEMSDDLNTAMPMVQLLETGFGLLGTMPKPLAERVVKVLEHHKVKYSLSEEVGFQTHDENGRSRLSKALLLDTSYIVALDYSVEELGKV